jgi:stage III sporulation protein AF
MFEFISQWLKNITFYYIIVTLILQMTPNQEYKKYIQFFTGLILILLLAEPVWSVTKMGVSIETYEEQMQQFEEAISYLDEVEN